MIKSANLPYVIALLLLDAGLWPARLALADQTAAGAADARPRVRDERLELSEWAANPDIVTPIGIAIDRQDRVFVLESHTHSPPSDYPGPGTDRIKILQDTDDDGRMDRGSVFAEGFDDGMNLKFSDEGILYVVEKKSVWALYDRNNDGVSEERKRILAMVEPERVYDHAGLLGLAFSTDGWMYVTRGNVGGSYWKLVGTDGSTVEGYGDGGNIMRCRPDGSELHEVATGFWNPFGVAVDKAGRVLITDNDPDSRGPNRFIHVVTGGDYGYKTLYGGSGINPYLAWNGELPGTLPYIVGLGESPTGLLEAGLARLPADYANSFLIGIWEESKIVKVELAPRGASLTGSITTVIQGGPDFRPVSFALSSKGDVFFTDWVKRVYPNHGFGRIWKLATRDRAVPAPDTKLQPDGGSKEMQSIYALDDPAQFDRLQDGLKSSDPFVRTAALVAAQSPGFQERLVELLSDPDAELRLGAVLALQRSGFKIGRDRLRSLLSDPDLRVRKMALIWTGRSGLISVQEDLVLAISSGNPTADLLETYFETLRHLDPAFVAGVANRIDRNQLPPRGRYVRLKSKVLGDESLPVSTRTAVMRFLDAPEELIGVIAPLAAGGPEPELRAEAVRTLARISSPEAAAALLRLAQDRANPSDLRAEAVFGLGRQSANLTPALIALLADNDDAVRLEAARSLRSQPLSDRDQSAIRSIFQSLAGKGDHSLRQQLALIVDPAALDKTRPAAVAEWEATLRHLAGDPQRGRRVFLSPQGQCAACHIVDNVGGIVGPNLTNVGASKTREQLIRSLIEPSAEIAPDWQGWVVHTAGGETHYGRQIDVKGETQVELMTLTGEFARFDDARSWGVSEASLMPEGLEKNLTNQDFADLIAYLESLK